MILQVIMKKIGLVTVTYVNNFGSHLQSFALQQVIRALGYDLEIITPEGLTKDINKRRLKYLLGRFYDMNELGSYLSLFKKRLAVKVDKSFAKTLSQRNKMFSDFTQKEYVISPITNSWEELNSLCSNYSSVVIGSDQNWRPANIAGGYYTIEYVPDNVNKVAYSTSFGISRVIPTQREKARYFLNRINHISVREDSGRKIIKDLLDRDVPVVCDPTILVKKEEWEHYIKTKSQSDLSEITQTPYILCYFLGENPMHRRFAQKLKKKTGFRIVSILYGEGRYYMESEEFYDIALSSLGPLDFVNLISKAQYVCTDSFHGCAFSLIFKKELYAFYKSSKNSKMSVNDRLDSMLGWAGVKRRIINDEVDITDSLLEPIDYGEVEKRIEEKREMSMQFLRNSLQ